MHLNMRRGKRLLSGGGKGSSLRGMQARPEDDFSPSGLCHGRQANPSR